MCDIIIPGLPTTLVGHIVPELSIASLFGISVLTEAGCTVKFDIEKCVDKYNGRIILTGMKDTTTDLWTLPIVGSTGKTSPMKTCDVPNITHAEQNAFVNLRDEFMEGASKFGLFSHTVRTKANSIKFAQQSMCSPKITTLLKAIRHGFLDGRPNLSAKGVTRYLNPSPATAKGHMKQPHQGIRSTTTRQP